MSEATTTKPVPAEMTDEEIRMEIAGIDQIAKQNAFKYEKRQRGDFPDNKWEKFVISQNEMFAYRADLEAELESREAAAADAVEE